MKHYILLSYITSSGGVQCYVAAKARYLEEQGWRVIVISNNDPKDNEECLIGSLNKYLPNGNKYQELHPCNIPRYMVRKAIKRYLDVIGPLGEKDEVIVESWNSSTALWGELVASRLHARHIFYAANEHFRNPNQRYEDKIDFFKFKMDRGEISTDVNGANRLFAGYWIYKKGDFIESYTTEEPIQDVESPLINDINKKDWNISYIGRSNKSYVPYIFEDIGKFANNHPDKKIQFIVVGEVVDNKDLLQKISNCANLTVIELGDLYPLPRSLYDKIDVVIAGSGSARHSMDQGVLVITADTFLNNSHGLLGYDTNETIEKAEDSMDITFEQALERALVEKIWMKKKNKWVKNRTVKECVESQFEILKRSSSKSEYYDENKLLEGKIELYGLVSREYFLLKKKIRQILKTVIS